MEEKDVKGVIMESENIEKKKPGCLKGCLTIFVLFIILGALIGACFGNDEETTDKKEEEQTVTAETKKTDEKKEEAKQIATEKENEKADKEALNAEIDFYKNELSPQLDNLQSEYDRIWNEQWTTTFNGVSDGSVDVYTAYQQMNYIETNYDVLNDEIEKVEGKSLSKENKELLESYKEKLSKSADYRAFAASEAAKMFDEGTYKPSELDNIKSIVSAGDDEMMQAIVDRLTVEQNLGLIEQTQQ